MKHFAKLFQSVNAIYVMQRNFEILGVWVATMDISQKICFINMFPAVHSMHKFYRNSLSYQPVIFVEY